MNRPLTYRPGYCILLLLSLLLVQTVVYGQRRPIVTQWAKSYGGYDLDEAHSIIQTTDGGFIFSGRAFSLNGQITNSDPAKNKWIVRTDSLGNILWEQSYGDYGAAIYGLIQTSDGGFAVCGSSLPKVPGPSFGHDMWVLKIDANGNIEWEKKFGGSGTELAYDIVQTNDGNYVVAGLNHSYDGDITDRTWSPSFSVDVWVIKLNASGDIIWTNSYGGSYEDRASGIVQTSDGGLAILAYGSSTDGDVTNHKHSGYTGVWLIKTDANGNKQWDKCYEAGTEAYANSIEQTDDGGFIIGAEAKGNGYDCTDYLGGIDRDIWVIKTDASGNMQWSKCYGGTKNEVCSKVVASRFGGYIIGGATLSTDFDVQQNYGNGDNIVIVTDASGNIVWTKTYGGTQYEYLLDLAETRDGGIITAGYASSTDMDITDHIGHLDYWIMKLGHKIATGPLSTLQYCAGDSVTVKDTLFGTFNPNNTFSVQLSDASGNFQNPLTIASFANNNTDSLFRVALPTTVAAGTGYRVRVVSTSPFAVYRDNGQDITIHQAPALPPGFLGKDTTVCTANSLNLQAPFVAGYQYVWQDNSTGNQHLATTTGDYIVNVTGPLGCKVKDTIEVNFNTIPDFSLGNDISVCSGETVTLQPVLPAGNYLWNTGSQTSTQALTNTGWYWLQVSNGGCVKTDSLLYSIKPGPWFNIGDDTTICEGSSFMLDVTNANATYLWQNGSTQPQYTVDGAGLYTIRVSIDGCDSTAQKRVDILVTPKVALGKDTTLCISESVWLDASFNGANYLWSNRSGDPRIEIRSEGVYSVAVSNNCGIARDTIEVKFENCDCAISVPSAFTPNNDGKHEIFKPISRCSVSNYELKVFNRWGQMMFISRSRSIGWDGRYGSHQQPEGTYVWTLQYRDDSTGKSYQQKGIVQLIR